MKFKTGDYFKVYSSDKNNWFIYLYNESGSKLVRSNYVAAYDIAPSETSDPNDISEWWHPPVKVTYLNTKLGKILYK